MSNTDATTAIVQKLLEAWSTDSQTTGGCPSGGPSRSAHDEVLAQTEERDGVETWELVGPNMQRPAAN